MPLQCNIDSRGKAVRLINGAIVLAIGILLAAFWAWGSHSALAWAISAACVLGGAFMLFEARAGWCVVRAMGFKTPL
jgi:hypothetical protein